MSKTAESGYKFVVEFCYTPTSGYFFYLACDLAFTIRWNLMRCLDSYSGAVPLPLVFPSR